MRQESAETGRSTPASLRMDPMATKNDLFEDMARALEAWSTAASEALTDPQSDLVWVEDEKPYREIQHALVAAGVARETLAKVLSECFRGLGHSFLVALDGGTALAEKGRLYVVDEHGRRVGEGLHDDFVGYLIDTGRLPK